jgi:WD40 repeat protein
MLLLIPVRSTTISCSLVYNISSFNNLHSHTSLITAIKVNTNHVFTIANDQKLNIWNITSGNLQYLTNFNISFIANSLNKSISYTGLDISKTNSNTMVLAGSNGTVTIYNLTNINLPTCISFKMGSYANYIGLNNNINRIIVTGYNSNSFGMMIYDYDGINWKANTLNYIGMRIFHYQTYGAVLSSDDKTLVILS